MGAAEFEWMLKGAVGAGGVLVNEPLARHTTFEIGGPAQWLVLPRTEEQVAAVVARCREAGVPWRVLGAGSNVLAPDEGLGGVVLKLAENFAATEVLPGGELRACAGATNEAVAALACEQGLSGYEFACGIPGTIGGAAYMNAGAYEGQFSDVCASVRCLDGEGHVVEVPAAQAQFGYRHSLMMEQGLVILGATLQLAPGNREHIRAHMADLQRRREEKQPLEMPSAGSTFKRPEGHFAGKLIQDAGMQGKSVGGAQVSEKHAGFVVNTGGATASDVLALVALVQQEVNSRFGVTLEPEVRLWQ